MARTPEPSECAARDPLAVATGGSFGVVGERLGAAEPTDRPDLARIRKNALHPWPRSCWNAGVGSTEFPGRVGPQRDFGLLVGSIFCALGAWWSYRGRHGAVGPTVLVLGGGLVLLGALAPKALRYPYRFWMALAEALAFVMTRVILAIVFFGIVTPIGLLRKAVGGDPLRRRAKPASSYWWPYSKRQRDCTHFEKMF